MENLLYSYINGNYTVSLYDDGTKVRETLDENATEFLSEFPEQFDCKITGFCDMGDDTNRFGKTMCEFCHEASNSKGKHADLDVLLNKIEGLKSGTEIACGGGDPLSHPHLEHFLKGLRGYNLVPNLTVNELHLNDSTVELLNHYIQSKLMFGLGLSYRKENIDHDHLFQMVENPNVVIHLIAGIDDYDDIVSLIPHMKNVKFLLLGYKTFRMGKNFKRKHPEFVEKNIQKWYNRLPLFLNTVVDRGGVVSFDNLAIEQLNVKRMLNQEEWNLFYQGDEATISMYLDAVKQEFAGSSIHVKRYPFADLSVVEMFRHLKNKN